MVIILNLYNSSLSVVETKNTLNRKVYRPIFQKFSSCILN